MSEYRHNGKMVVSMSSLPGRSQFGGGSVAAIPRLTQASTVSVHQPSVHTIVHTHPQNPPTPRPVIPSNARSKITPTPMRMKKPPTVRNSVPRPRPHNPRSCITADTPNAPNSAPWRPKSALPGRAPKTMNTCRKNTCQRNLQKSAIDVDIHGRLEGGGHCQAGCRKTRRPTSDAMW